jgi:hypothetical protein
MRLLDGLGCAVCCRLMSLVVLLHAKEIWNSDDRWKSNAPVPVANGKSRFRHAKRSAKHLVYLPLSGNEWTW